MKMAIVKRVALILCVMAVHAWTLSLPVYAVSAASAGAVNSHAFTPVAADSVAELRDLATIVSRIAPISQETMVRRNIAQATFCLPQNILGRLLYGLLQLTGRVVETADMNEVKIVVTKAPIGVSLGRYILLHEFLLTENIVRHEYGHTMQGYKHGPFFLLFEGLVSFVQAAFSMISPSFAAGYYERWPENEANELGGIKAHSP